MIKDSQTNTVFISETCSLRFPDFYNALNDSFKRCWIYTRIIDDTNSINIRSFMPIQISNKEFLVYQNNSNDLFQPNSENLLQIFGIHGRIEYTDLVLDGRNFVKSKNNIIMTDKVIEENPNLSENEIISEIAKKCRIRESNVLIIPKDKDDIYGNAADMMRFMKKNLLFINDYSKNPIYQLELENKLTQAGFNFERIPYNPYENATKKSRKGIYTNILSVKNISMFTVFNLKEEHDAYDIYSNFYHYKSNTEIFNKIINCVEIAEQGFSLYDICWNIKE